MSLKTTLNESVVVHVRVVKTPTQPIKSATAIKGSTTLVGVVAGAAVASPTAVVPGLGRNLTLTVANAGGSTTPAVTIRIVGRDQFGKQITEDISQSGTGVALGEKIFSKVESIKFTAASGIEASDTYSIGTGDKVGLPVKLRDDLADVVGAQLVNSTTVTAKTVNTTNLDVANSAVKAAAFASSAVAAGDVFELLLNTTRDSPDNRFA